MRRTLYQALTLVLFTMAIGCYGDEFNSRLSVATDGATSNPTNRMLADEAFRRALGSIKRRVNLMDSNADFRLVRTENGEWLIQIKGGSDVPEGGLSILVTEKRAVELRLSQTNADAQAWLASGEASKPDPGIKVRPEVAFRQGLEALAKWWAVGPDCFLTPGGKIRLTRARKEEWVMNITGYSSTRHDEWRVTINDNGRIEAAPVTLGL